jgi:hypothetical protein
MVAARPGTGPPSAADLDRLWRGYCRRADLVQTCRFIKQALRWVTPRVRLPEQADRWTWLVLAAYVQLRLARGAVAEASASPPALGAPAPAGPSHARAGAPGFRDAGAAAAPVAAAP